MAEGQNKSKEKGIDVTLVNNKDDTGMGDHHSQYPDYLLFINTLVTSRTINWKPELFHLYKNT